MYPTSLEASFRLISGKPIPYFSKSTFDPSEFNFKLLTSYFFPNSSVDSNAIILAIGIL